MGDRNRGWVIRALTDHGPLSRSELAKRADATRGTVGSIVQGLIDDGLLEELDPIGTGEAGKPRRPLWFASGAGTVAALELRSDEMRAATIDARGVLSRQAVVSVSDATDRGSTVDAAIEALDAVTAEGRPIGIGLAVPGACDLATGAIYGSTQLPSLVGSGLADSIVKRFNLPAYVENRNRTGHRTSGPCLPRRRQPVLRLQEGSRVRRVEPLKLESGLMVSPSRPITKEGPPELRLAFYQAANVARQVAPSSLSSTSG